MITYFSTFITGFEKIVEDQISQVLPNAKITLLTDGLVIYQTKNSPEEIKKIKFFNNSFILLKMVNKSSSLTTEILLSFLAADKTVSEKIKQYFSKKPVKFRIRASVKNQFVAINRDFLSNLENKIMQQHKNFKLDRSLPDIELQATVRSEGFGLLGLRFTHHTNYEKTLQKGELYPELAYFLCLTSEPAKEDIFLDPFSGYGGILIQRAINFPFTRIFAGDSDSNLVGFLRKRQELNKKEIKIEKMDALNLSDIKDQSITKIVTDPPWGIYGNRGGNIAQFYVDMLKEFHRITKKDGLVIILTSQKELLEKQLKKFTNKFKLLSKYNTLVSGKKAGVYKLLAK